MSKIKKMLGVLMAAMLCFALTPMAAFAAESGSIKVDNAIKDQTYKLYQIADLKVSGTNKTSYAYTPAEGWEAFWSSVAVEGNPYGISIVNGNIVFDGKSMQSDDPTIAKLASVARDWPNKPAAKWTEKAEGSEVVFDNLPLGYFFLDSTTGTICSLTSSAPNDTIKEKNEVPSVDKEVLENSNKEWGPDNNASIGDTVNFQTTITVAKGAKNYIYHDKMDPGLTFNNDVVVKVDGVEVSANDYTVTPKPGDEYDCTFDVAFDDNFIKGQVGKKIVVTYSAVLNADAVLSNDSNDNEAKLTYGDNNVVSNEDETKTYTGSMTVFKHNENNEALAGAEFTLANTSEWAISSDPIKFIKLDDQTYRPAVGNEENATTTLVTPEGGKFTIVGLDAGTYALTETKAPEGYNMLTTPQTVTIPGADNVDTSAVGIGKADVENKSGLELPSTGGIGTTIFYIVGGVLVVGAIAFLIVRRRMNSAK